MSGKTETTKAETTAKDTEPKYTLEALKKVCMTVFGVTSSTFAAATYKLTGEYTITEMKKHIETWLKKEVK